MTIVPTTCQAILEEVMNFCHFCRVNKSHSLMLPTSWLIFHEVFILTLPLYSIIYAFPHVKFLLNISSPKGNPGRPNLSKWDFSDKTEDFKHVFSGIPCIFLDPVSPSLPLIVKCMRRRVSAHFLTFSLVTFMLITLMEVGSQMSPMTSKMATSNLYSLWLLCKNLGTSTLLLLVYLCCSF